MSSSVFVTLPYDSAFPLRRIISRQCSSTSPALASSCQSKTAFLNSRRFAPSTSPGKRRITTFSTESALRPCHVRSPSVAVLFAFVMPSFLLLLLFNGTNAMPNEREEQRMCGRLLIQALKMVCNHQYAQPNRDNFYETTGVALRVRRSPAPRSYVVKRHQQPLEDGTAPMAESHRATSRSRRGIIWECCTNKCSLNYIRNNYCAAPPPQVEQTDDNAVAAFQLEEDERK